MPIFGASKTQTKPKGSWDDLTQKGFTKRCKDLKTVAALRRLTGSFCDASILAFWNKFRMDTNAASYLSEEETVYWDDISNLFQHEINCVLQGHRHLASLASRARSGAFVRTPTLRHEVMAPADYGAKETDSNLEKATHYIMTSSASLAQSANNPNAPVNAVKVNAALLAASTTMDVRNESTLRYLHHQLVNQAGLEPTRNPSLEVIYPSSGGSGFLIEKTFNLARGMIVPAQHDLRWFDLACFLFGAVVRSHGFVDGNGRVGRGAYAVAMLASGLPFVAPKASAETLLTGMGKLG